VLWRGHAGNSLAANTRKFHEFILLRIRGGSRGFAAQNHQIAVPSRFDRRKKLLFHLYQLTALSLVLGNDLFLEYRRHKVIVPHFHIEAAAALGH